ncbi:MAG: rhamnulose-1-phosphate aldolase [Anaerolineales bacterium]
MAEFVSMDFLRLIDQIGQAGRRLSELGAAEGAAGNISVCLREPLDVTGAFPFEQAVDLPLPVPELAGTTLIVTGSGRRLREIADAPGDNLACIVVEHDGKTGKMLTVADPPFRRVTSEFNSHLAIHHDRMKGGGIDFHAVLHAQPLHLTYLSHIPAYQHEQYFNAHLFRWQPETILSMPQGIGVLPFIVNGSSEQMTATVQAMREHSLVVWARHGVVARSDESVMHALDLIEYAEAAARYETLNLSSGERADGLSPEEVRRICAAWGVAQAVY